MTTRVAWRAAGLVGGVLLSGLASAKPVEAVLRLEGHGSMAELAAAVSDPWSPRFQQFYTPDEIRDAIGPWEAEYHTLLHALHAAGVRVVRESPTRLMLTVVADRAVLETLFSGDLARTMQPVVAVSGLRSPRRSRPRHRVHAAEMTPMATARASGTSLATIRKLYGFDALYKAGLSGKGQHIAIATYDGFHLDDVAAYWAKQGLKPAPTVDQISFNGTAALDAGSAVETELDAEFAGALAPQAQIHVFASAHNDDAGELQMFTAILDDGRAHVVNYSWGDCESRLAKAHQADMDPVFLRAVAQGVNIMVASGDSGSDCLENGSVMPDWPAAHPAVVAVGGTRLGTSTTKLSETGWTGSGGGVSRIWPLPTWQAGLGRAYVRRSYPDVAFNADPKSGQAAWVRDGTTSPAYEVIGGTSIAAPQWSAFLALVGEARAAAGKAPVGFLNPIVYRMSATERGAAFDDVKKGSNGAYASATGWDAVTGFGGLHADALLKYLKAL
jgi:kumamolisin